MSAHSWVRQVGLAWLMLLAAEVDAGAAWPDEHQLGPVTVHADHRLHDLPEIEAQLGRLQHDLRRSLQLAQPSRPIHLFLFHRRPAYEQYLHRYFPEAPRRRALFIRAPAAVYVFAWRHERWFEDLRHEMTHALLHADLPMVPLWLDEGLAECFEGLPRPADRHWSTMMDDPRLKRLELIHDLSRMGQREYELARDFVRSVLQDPVARQQLLAFLEDIRQLRPPGSLLDRLQAVTDR